VFHIDRKRLLDAVSRVGMAASKQYSAVPAMEGILFSHAPHGSLRLEATNGEQRIEQRIYTEASEGFERLVHGKAVIDALKAQKQTFVDVLPDGPGMRVGDVTCPGLKLADWPKQPGAGASVGKLRAPSFLDCLARAALAMSKDAYRPTLNGLSMLNDPQVGMRLVATDSFWLAAIDVPHATLSHPDPLILPAGAVAILVKLLKGEEGPVTLSLSKERPNEKASRWTWLWFRHARWTFVTRTVDGEFPNWRQLMPEPDQGYALDLSIAELRDVVDAARKLRAERMEFHLNGEIEVEAKGAVAAVSRMIPGVFEGNGQPLDLVVNPELLHKALVAVPSASIRVQDGVKPLVLRGKGAVALVMPIRMPVEPPPTTPAPRPTMPPPPGPEEGVVREPTAYVQDGPYLRPESDGDAEEEALDEYVDLDDDDEPVAVAPGEADDDDDEGDLIYIGRHAFRELGWQPDLGADGYECCTCEEVVTYAGVDGTTGAPHRCWLKEGDEE